MVYANLQPPDRTARRSPAGWWSLTPPSHPYSLRSGTFLLPYPAVTDCLHFHKRSVLCCPDFPLAPTQDASDRPWHCFQPAKLQKNERNAKGKLAFLFISECIVSSAYPKLRKVERRTKDFNLFYAEDGVSSPLQTAKLQKNERNAKGKLAFLLCCYPNNWIIFIFY